jgi:gluconokinase
VYHSAGPLPETSARPACIVVITGVSGSGKTTVGRALAERLSWRFHDADDLHSAENVERMRRGLALSDAMRAPWLARVRGVIEDAIQDRAGAVIACSALKARYRTFLSDGLSTVRFVFLNASREVLLQRLARRRGHFAGPTLLDSQLDALEPPADALTLDASRPVAELVDAIRDYACECL